MSIIRVHKTKNYTVMCNYHFKEKEMSLKAKGLLSQMLSLPDDWNYSIAGLVALNKENETAIKSALNELKKFGYLKITKLNPSKTSSGKYEYQYDVFEKPQKPNQGGDFLPLENLPIEKQGQLNTEKLSTIELSPKTPRNYISKDNNLLGDTAEACPLGASKISSNNNINNNLNSVVASRLKEESKSAPPMSENSHKEKSNKKSGLAPLIDMVDKKYDKYKYAALNTLLRNYLQSYIGVRRLPSIEKWEEMLNLLEHYSSNHIAGAEGTKFFQNRAMEIVNKAITGRNGIPFTEFDDIYNRGKLMEPAFNLNQDFVKGY